MPHDARKFINDGVYHIVLRRIGNEVLFKDLDDHYRAVFYIYECNTSKPVVIRERRAARKKFKELIKQTKDEITPVWIDERDFLVDVLAFALMPNHIHLLLRQLKDNGIPKYIQKMASGYAAYFKNKYSSKIKGYFFQDRFKSVCVTNLVQLQVMFVYIHTNPLSLIEPNWKEVGVRDKAAAMDFLVNRYRWSSLFDYLGKANFPSVTKRDLLTEVMGGPKGIIDSIKNWIEYKHDIASFNDYFK